ncbi:E3 ubiquitin-protein ligase At4g11680-like [Apium graveolens]|uniref:E3 ubiquitin-protein ligase At4g11680-like n=1 Tax=Apium graveolens TaxID=4045 RepID=UPI003D79A33B
MNSLCNIFPHKIYSNSRITALASAASAAAEDRNTDRNNLPRVTQQSSNASSVLVRMAIRISRARWYSFLRRVFYYQNNMHGSSSLSNSENVHVGSNPYNTSTCMVLESVALSIQIIIISYTLCVSKEEKPVWPMRVWISGYDLASFLNLVLLVFRYRLLCSCMLQRSSDDDHQRSRVEEYFSRRLNMVNRFRTCIELFLAIWFVMGNIWLFDYRFGSSHRAPKLHLLCIFLLVWNAIAYSFPFLLFLFLCCFVPLISNLLGYNMNMGSINRGASDEQLARLSCWKYKDHVHQTEVGSDLELGNFIENQECCICLGKYKEKEEIRQLPCSHTFHLQCVDQWLRIISCCPLCKQQLKR